MECHCRCCLLERGMEIVWMVVCPICGNKRCPKATDCQLACTNSNNVDQEGSVYGNPSDRYNSIKPRLMQIVDSGDYESLRAFCIGREPSEVRELAREQGVDLDKLEELLSGEA